MSEFEKEKRFILLGYHVGVMHVFFKVPNLPKICICLGLGFNSTSVLFFRDVDGGVGPHTCAAYFK